jgi:DNA-binding transcriptional MerR regulator
MTTALLNLTELAARADVPAERLRHYAEVSLLPPARRDGDRLGYPPAEAHTMRMLAGVEDLGIGRDDLIKLATAWRDGDCPAAQHRLADAVNTRLTSVQHTLAEHLRQATAHGPGSTGWADTTRASVPLTEAAARLQAVAAALGSAPHAGPCGEDCGCAAALATPGAAYHFPAADGGQQLACDLVADGGDANDRIDVWQQVLTRVQRRDPLPDTDTGLALQFPLDADLAATLARLAAAECRCCSFGSYTIVIDDTGLRLEVRMPADATGMLDAVLGQPDPDPDRSEGAVRADHQP